MADLVEFIDLGSFKLASVLHSKQVHNKLYDWSQQGAQVDSQQLPTLCANMWHVHVATISTLTTSLGCCSRTLYNRFTNML